MNSRSEGGYAAGAGGSATRRGAGGGQRGARPRCGMCHRFGTASWRTRPAKRGITRDYTPFLLMSQGMALGLQGIAPLPSNITRDGPPMTRDCPPSLLTLQGSSLTGSPQRAPRYPTAHSQRHVPTNPCAAKGQRAAQHLAIWAAARDAQHLSASCGQTATQS